MVTRVPNRPLSRGELYEQERLAKMPHTRMDIRLWNRPDRQQRRIDKASKRALNRKEGWFKRLLP